jgi:hypothetical protein
MTLQRLIVPVLASAALVAAASNVEARSALPITKCGQIVTADAVLTQDLVCSDKGIVVGAPGITIDLHGFVLRYVGSGNPFGIEDLAGYDDVTVKNGIVRNFYNGVHAYHADRFTVANLVVTGSRSSGVVIVQSAAGTIQSSRIFGTGRAYISSATAIGSSPRASSATTTAESPPRATGSRSRHQPWSETRPMAST